ncbi:hypothetical protein J7J13_02765 [bacterium]|nr:hypothetical protein [bacterium]
MKDKNVRKLVKNGRGSYYINIPKDILRSLGWRERQRLKVKRIPGGVVVRDYRKK